MSRKQSKARGSKKPRGGQRKKAGARPKAPSQGVSAPEHGEDEATEPMAAEGVVATDDEDGAAGGMGGVELDEPVMSEDDRAEWYQGWGDPQPDAPDGEPEDMSGDMPDDMEGLDEDARAAEGLDEVALAEDVEGEEGLDEAAQGEEGLDEIAFTEGVAGEEGLDELVLGQEGPGQALPVEVDEQLLRLKSIVESLLYASDKPLPLRRLAQLTQERDAKRLRAVVDMLMADYRGRGIVLHDVAGGLQFRTAPENSEWVQQLVSGRPVKLSRAQLETLAIIAYRQPITRPEIDDIRGVDSGGTLKVLIDRHLIRVLGKKEEPGRPLLYGTTKDFLEFFNLHDLRELPTLREYHELTEDSMRVVERMGMDLDDLPGRSQVAPGTEVAEGEFVEIDDSEFAERVVGEVATEAGAGEDGQEMAVEAEGAAEEGEEGAVAEAGAAEEGEEGAVAEEGAAEEGEEGAVAEESAAEAGAQELEEPVEEHEHQESAGALADGEPAETFSHEYEEAALYEEASVFQQGAELEALAGAAEESPTGVLDPAEPAIEQAATEPASSDMGNALSQESSPVADLVAAQDEPAAGKAHDDEDEHVEAL